MGRRLWIGLGAAALALCAAVILFAWPSDPEPGWPKVPLNCVGRVDEEVCVIFEKDCRSCHFGVGVQNLSGPDLVGLVGRERHFASGDSLVADEAYIERAIADHKDRDELVPGYAPWSREQLTPASRSAAQVSALAAFVMSLEPHPREAVVEIHEELTTSDERVSKIRRIVQFHQDSLRNCYQAVAYMDRDLGGSFLVDFRAIGDSRFGASVVESSVSHSVIETCMENTLGYLQVLERDQAPDGSSLARYHYRLTTKARR